jgi:hypothetical protein
VIPVLLAVTVAVADPPVLSEFPVDTTLVPIAWTGYQSYGPALASDGTNSLVIGSHWWFGQGATRIDRDCGILDYSPAVAPDNYPAVAFDGTNWLAVGASDSGPVAARYTRSGTLIDTLSYVSRRPGARAAVAAGNGPSLVVWADPDVWAARVDVNGNVLDTAGVLICNAPGSQAEPAVAFDGTNWLVTWQDIRSAAYYDIYAARVSPAGTVLDPGGFVVSGAQYSQFNPAVTWTGTSFIVTWQDYRDIKFDIYASRVSSSGAVLDPDGIVVARQAMYQRFPAAATGFGQTLVLWERWDSAGCSGIWGARLDAAGIVLDTAGFLVAPAGEGEASLTFDGSRFVAAWLDTAGYQLGSWIDTSGAVGFPEGRPVCAGASEQRMPTAASNGTCHLVAWVDEKTGDTLDIRAIRVDSLGQQMDSAPVTISAAPRAQFWPQVGGSSAGWLVAWYDQRDSTWSVYCCRVTSEGVPLDTEGIAVCSTAFVGNMKPAVAWCGTGWLVAWDDTRGPGGGVYAARINTSGYVLDPQGFPVYDTFTGTSHPSLTACRNRWLLTYDRGYQIWASFIDLTGYIYEPFRVSPSGSGPWMCSDVAFDSSGFLVAYNRYGRELYAARVDTLGNVLDTAGIAAGVSWVYVPSAVPSREGWLVAGSRWAGPKAIRGAAISTSGAVLDTFTLPFESSRPGWPELSATADRRPLLAYVATPGEVNGHNVGDARRIYAAVEPFLGMKGRDASPGMRPALRATPSVFHARTRLSLELRANGQVRLRIYDRSGRQIRTLLDTRAGPKAVTLNWDGTDQHGRRLPAGVYICRLELDGQAAATRAVVLHQ